MDKLTVMKQKFGHSGFRPGQEALVDALMAGRDVLGVMPTGAGKSVCYQLPALLLPGLTVVLSPLISLMKDQVASLEQSGVPAAYLNSTVTGQEYRATWGRAARGELKLLYVAPERLTTEGFQHLMEQVTVSLVAVDEAHCVSQWGQDFRPSYLEIRRFLDSLPVRPPVGAFTATATETVKQDIVDILGLREPLRLTTGFDRPNLFFDVVRPRDKDQWICQFLEEHREESGILYCATRKAVDAVCTDLQERGFAAGRYHAGLTDQERRQNQEDFVYDRTRVMVATNAFGMGIDKSNVSYVIHYNMPKNLESYYQEAGRAGRDGSPARCVLLFAPGDVQTAQFLIDNVGENEALTEEERQQIRRQDMDRLQAMAGYCKTSSCYRAWLLRYFGEEAPDQCGSCGNCTGELVRTDITVEAQKILSGVARVRRGYDFGMGMNLVLQMLAGSKSQQVLRLGLDKLPTYGILKEHKRDTIRAWMDCLLEQGYLVLDQESWQYPVLGLTEQAKEVLFQGEQVFWTRRRTQPEAAVSAEPAVQGPLDEGLLTALKDLRTRLAREQNVPGYVVFSNAALTDMARRQPRTMEAFLEVSGVGQVKADRYGQVFLDAIRQWAEAEQEAEHA